MIEHDAGDRAVAGRMLADVEGGRPISALPADVAGILASAIETAPASAVRVALERERDSLEVLAISGNVPDEFLLSYAASIADAEQRSRYFAFLADWSNLAGRKPDSVDVEIELSRALIAQFRDSGTFTDLHSDTTERGDVGMPVSLDDVITDPAQREVVLRVQCALLDVDVGVRPLPRSESRCPRVPVESRVLGLTCCIRCRDVGGDRCTALPSAVVVASRCTGGAVSVVVAGAVRVSGCSSGTSVLRDRFSFCGAAVGAGLLPRSIVRILHP